MKTIDIEQHNLCARILITFACISSFGDIVLLTNLISIPARYGTFLHVSFGTQFTNSLKFKDSVCGAGAPDPPDLVANPRFLTTEKKISSVVDEDDSKPYALVWMLGAGNARYI